MIQRRPHMVKTARTLLWVLCDAVLVNAAMIIAQLLRYATDTFLPHLTMYVRLSLPLTVLSLVTFWLFGLYRSMWQYVSAADLLRVAMATLTAAILVYLFSISGNAWFKPRNLFWMHRIVYLLYWNISMVLVCGSRLVYRLIVTKEGFSLFRPFHVKLRRVMVIGAGWAGASVVRDMQYGSYGACEPVLIVDDDVSRTGSRLNGVPVVRGSGNILKLSSNYAIDDIIIAIATPDSDLTHLIEKCLATGCAVKRAAFLQDIDGDCISTVRDIIRNESVTQPVQSAVETEPAEDPCPIHERMMLLALEEAQAAYDEGETPVGAVVVRDGQVLAKAHNTRENGGDPTAHAEILAIRQAAKILGTRRLTGCTLYVTLEPCPMCAGAMVMAALDRCYFGARDTRQGCAESVYALTQEPSFYHRLPCVGGLLEEKSQALLTDFFQQRRGERNIETIQPRSDKKKKKPNAKEKKQR